MVETLTTRVYFYQTGILAGQDCELQIIEPTGFHSCFVIIDNESGSNEDELPMWDLSPYTIFEAYQLLLRATDKLLTQVHSRLITGQYTVEEFKKTFKCFRRPKALSPRDQPPESSPKDVPAKAAKKKKKQPVKNLLEMVKKENRIDDLVINSDEDESIFNFDKYIPQRESDSQMPVNEQYKIYD